MNERERVETIMRCYNLTPSQFADKSGIQRASVSHILSGRNKLSLDIVLKIHDSFPAVDLEWLMTGIGVVPTIQHDTTAAITESTLFTTSEVKREESENVPQQPMEYTVKSTKQTTKQHALKTPRNTTRSIPSQDTGKRIKEVRIFYTDGTYETLIPEK